MDPSDLLRNGLLWMADSDRVRRTIEQAPVSRNVVKRFVAGETVADAVDVAEQLRSTQRQVTIDYLGEFTTDPEQAQHTADTYISLLEALAASGLTADRKAEVSVKLSAVGQSLPEGGEDIALANARRICEAAAAAGTTVTLDMEDHDTTDSTLRILAALREDYPSTGAVLQAMLHRTEQDCHALATEGSRVRLCKGAYREPETVAYQSKDEIDKNYIRCLKILMEGKGYPMIASHDPRILDIARALAAHHGRSPDTFEYQMLLGIRMNEQKRIADRGDQMRVYLPFGEQWYGYLMRRMAERPANTMFFVRGLVGRN